MEKNNYFYDLHCHTKESIDSPAKLKDIVQVAKKRGLSGFAVTDHDKRYKGPICVDTIDIIPGAEITLRGGGHLLAYFITQDIPSGLTLKEAVSAIKKQGGFAVLAHPLRKEHGHLKNKSGKEKKEILSLVDGLEAGNASDSDDVREATLDLKGNFFLTAGSDAHMAGQIGFAAVKASEKINKDNFGSVLSQSEIIVRPESLEFRNKSLFWRGLLSFFAKPLRIAQLQRGKKLFHVFVLRNYFRLNNRKFSRIDFNFNH